MHNNRKPLPPLNALRVFEAAARHSSFKLAAEEIFVTQSAISRQIQVLEKYYGTVLFIRKTRKVELTTEGRILFKATTLALDYVAAASHEVFVKQNRGYLTIASTITFSTHWMMPRMQNLREKYPDIQLGNCQHSCTLNQVTAPLSFQDSESLLFHNPSCVFCRSSDEGSLLLLLDKGRDAWTVLLRLLLRDAEKA